MGNSVPEVEASESSFCVECGAGIDPDSSYCPECGHSLSDEDPDTPQDEHSPDSGATVEPGKQSRWGRIRSSRKLTVLTAVGAASLLLIASLTAFWVIRQRNDDDRARKALLEIQASEEWLASRPGKLSNLKGVAAFGREAGERAARLKEVADSASKISNQEQREALTMTTRGLGESFAAFGRAQSLSDRSLDPWRRERAKVQSGLASVRVAWPEILRLAKAQGLDRFPAVERLTSIVQRSEVVIASALRRITAWKLAVRAAERTRATQLADLATYEARMRSQISTYASLRDETANFIERANTPGTGVTFDEAYSFITQAQSNRGGVQSAMRGLTPPSVAIQPHSLMVDAIGQAVMALGYAYSGLQEYQADKGSYYREYNSFKETPSWQEWNSAGSAAASKWTTALSGWESGIAAARKSIRTRPLPKRPAV